MMHTSTVTKTRSATSTCTTSRVEAVLDLFLGDVAGLMSRGLLTRERALGWVRDLQDVLVLEAVERFQVKITFPDGSELALDYQVSDDAQISGSDACGGLSWHWIPPSARVRLVVRWRTLAPKYAAAHALLAARGWGPATMLEASGAPDRTFAKDGYGLQRRTVGNWQV